MMNTTVALQNTECLTPDSTGNDQLLYFTSSSITNDNRYLFFISDRGGHPNLWVKNLATGVERSLSQNFEGALKSYVYFDGNPYRGFGKGSVSLHPESGTAYYLQGKAIQQVSPSGEHRTLAQLPDDQMTAFTHVSADGTRLCVPTTDAEALDGDQRLAGKPDYDIDERVRTRNLASYLRIYDTRTGELIACEKVPRAWITHVQFSPINSNLLLYNHEWPSDCGIRRMWLWDGKRHQQLRTEEDGRSRQDWACHEMWERDGNAIIYHGRYANGISFLGRMNPDGSDPVEIPFDPTWKRYGHFTVGNPHQLVSDGYYQEEEEPERTGGGAWICDLKADWKNRTLQWNPLCRNGSSWTSQDCHPHPIFDHEGKMIYFTSDHGGRRAIYRISTGQIIPVQKSLLRGKG